MKSQWSRKVRPGQRVTPGRKELIGWMRLESLGGQVEVGEQGAVRRSLVGHYAHRRASAGERRASALQGKTRSGGARIRFTTGCADSGLWACGSL